MKMSLQPIIENYIVHGLKAKQEDNRITIQIEQEESLLRIQIQDNGVGIEQEKLRELQQSLAAPESTGDSFGLRSVNDRLKLFYGMEQGMEIESELGKGTAVTIWLPYDEGRAPNDV